MMLVTVRVVVGAALLVDLFLRWHFGRGRKLTRVLQAAKGSRTKLPGAVLMVAVGGLYYLGLLVFAAWPGLLRSVQLPMLSVVSVVGMAVLAGGLVLVGMSHRALGSSFSVAVKPLAGQPLVTSGPYARVRHPLYLAQLLLAGGAALATANLLHATVWLLCLVVLVPRARAEDRALAAAFPDSWRQYAARTGLLLPRWR